VKINKKRIGGLIMVIIGLIMILASCSNAITPGLYHSNKPTHVPAPVVPVTTPTPEVSGPLMLSVHEGAQITDNAGTEEGSIGINRITVTTRPADPVYGEAPANGYYVIVQITAKAKKSYTDGSFDVNMFDFYSLSNGTQQFQPDNGNSFYALSDRQNASDITANLGAGQAVSGWIAFDVPSKHGEIVYAPNYDGQPLAEWSY
jgi:hypothetical protein